jgi:hypothetical protein
MRGRQESSSSKLQPQSGTKDPQRVRAVYGAAELRTFSGREWGDSPIGFWGGQGTVRRLVLQTFMNEQSKSKRIGRDLSARVGHGFRTVTRAKRVASQRKCANPNTPLAGPDPCFNPARGLVICMGWLRLFQTIVSDRIPSASKFGRNPWLLRQHKSRPA